MVSKTTQSIINIKSYGAVGDGETSDQTALDNALADIPAEGGTIFFPNGTYLLPSKLVIHDSGTARNNVRLVGETRENTKILNTTSGQNGIELSEYRRGGWETGLDDIAAYTDTVNAGQGTITLQTAGDASNFSVGDKIFIAAGGSAQFDQEYGEFNRIKAIDGAVLTLEKNLARDYRTDYATYSALLDADFTAPALDATVDIDVEMLVVNGYPGALVGISIGNDLYEFVSTDYEDDDPAGVYTWTVRNIRSDNTSGTISAGTKIFKQRVIIKTPETTSGTVIENLTIEADGDVVNLSNSMDTVIKDCTLIRRSTTSGLWADMDDGRNAKFINCKIEQEDAWDAAQPARSFGELHFIDCEFVNAGIDWSEFCFDGLVQNCRFYLSNPTAEDTTYGISFGWSTTNMRAINNIMYGDSIGTLIDIEPDIQAWYGAYRGGFIIKDNILHGTNLDRFIRITETGTAEVSGNHIYGDAIALFAATGHVIPADSDGTQGTVTSIDRFINSSHVNIHHNFFAGVVDTINIDRPSNLIMEDNWFHYQEARSGTSTPTNFKNGSIMWNSGGQSYGHIEILRIRRNTFKNWPYADGTVTGAGYPEVSFNFDPSTDATDGETVRTDITDNLFLDAQQGFISGGSPLTGLTEFTVDIYPT